MTPGTKLLLALAAAGAAAGAGLALALAPSPPPAASSKGGAPSPSPAPTPTPKPPTTPPGGPVTSPGPVHNRPGVIALTLAPGDYTVEVPPGDNLSLAPASDAAWVSLSSSASGAIPVAPSSPAVLSGADAAPGSTLTATFLWRGSNRQMTVHVEAPSGKWTYLPSGVGALVQPGQRVRMSVTPANAANIIQRWGFTAPGLGLWDGWQYVLAANATQAVLQPAPGSMHAYAPAPSANTVPAGWPPDDTQAASEYHVEFTYAGLVPLDPDSVFGRGSVLTWAATPMILHTV
jgi:hypothetical protein